MEHNELRLKYQPLFDMVKNQRNDKNPINTEIELDESEFQNMIDAIAFFTGSRDTKITIIDNNKVHITAEGYFNAIGD